MHGETVKPIS